MRCSRNISCCACLCTCFAAGSYQLVHTYSAVVKPNSCVALVRTSVKMLAIRDFRISDCYFCELLHTPTAMHQPALLTSLSPVCSLLQVAEKMEMESIRDSYSLGVKPPPKSVTATAEWRRLVAHARHMKRTHLRDVMGDAARCEALSAEFEGSFLDYSRMQVQLLHYQYY
jgi:hypothetical protein